MWATGIQLLEFIFLLFLWEIFSPPPNKVALNTPCWILHPFCNSLWSGSPPPFWLIWKVIFFCRSGDLIVLAGTDNCALCTGCVCVPLCGFHHPHRGQPVSDSKLKACEKSQEEENWFENAHLPLTSREPCKHFLTGSSKLSWTWAVWLSYPLPPAFPFTTTWLLSVPSVMLFKLGFEGFPLWG